MRKECIRANIHHQYKSTVPAMACPEWQEWLSFRYPTGTLLFRGWFWWFKNDRSHSVHELAHAIQRSALGWISIVKYPQSCWSRNINNANRVKIPLLRKHVIKHRHAVHVEPVTFLFLPWHKCAQLVTFVCKWAETWPTAIHHNSAFRMLTDLRFSDFLGNTWLHYRR